MRSKLLMTTACLLSLSTAALAGKDEDTARIALRGEISSLDVYYDASREALITATQIYDGLVYQDPETGKIVPNLAESWSWVDDKTLEFKLRQGVKFSNDEPFDADDVVSTINYVVDPASQIVVSDTVKWMKSAEKVDQYTVRLHLNAVYPMALNVLAMATPIYPNEYYAEVGKEGMSTAPVGTGPYRVTSVQPGAGYALEKNPNYFDGPKGAAGIGKIEVRTLRDVNTQLAELMTGNLDLIWQVPSDISDRLQADGNFTVVAKPTMRVGFLTMDAMNRSTANSPFVDIRVRQAFNHAIDRQGVVDALIKGGAQVINSACAPIQFGCEQDVMAYDYDPEKAKALLAEAGYPEGFAIEMTSYRDKPLAEVIVDNLAAVGVTVTLTQVQYSAITASYMDGKTTLTFQTNGSNSINDIAALTPQYFGLSPNDYSGDKEVAALIEEGNSTIDPDDRKAAYSKALKLIAERAYWVPLWTYSTNYAMNKELKFDPTSDELLRFYDMAWN